jgi:integrator complex subunit 7
LNCSYWSGALARILSEKKQVHHKVRSSLDSQDAVELEAAIYAAERLDTVFRMWIREK